MNAEDGRAQALARGVAREFRRRLADESVPRIRRCTELLDDARCWQRPGPSGNSIGNLLLHLEGNVRQWILVGLGGEPDRRDRPAEFAATGAGAPAIRELVARLERTVAAACALVDRLDPEALLAERTIQEVFRETGLSATLHVLEHFAGHAGQIYAWTKQLTGQDLHFYDL